MLVLAWRVVLAVREDVATLRTRVAAHERELGEVRRAAAVVATTPAPGADDSPLIARLEAAAATAVGRERVASMTPVAGDSAGPDERAALRVAGVSLAEVVTLLHGLEAANPPLHTTRLELRKVPDDPARFDTTVEVAGARPVR
jgi:hypothetical protein